MGMNPYEEGNNGQMGTENKRKKSRKGGQAWRAIIAVAIAVLFFLTGVCTVWFSLDPQMRALIKTKKAIDDQYYKEIDDSKFYGEIFGVVNTSLLDDYSAYMTEAEFKASNQQLKGSRSGIGVYGQAIQENGKTYLQVIRICGNSPAEQVGLREGDVIVGLGKTQTEINDSSVDFEILGNFMAEFQDEEEFFVKIRRGDTESVVALYKCDYVENYLFYRTNTTSYSFTVGKDVQAVQTQNPLLCLDADTAYIRLVQFGGNAAKAFKKAMELFRLEGKKNLLLDMRGNGGGYLDIMQEIASYFCKDSTSKSPVALVADYGEKKEKYKATGNYYHSYFSEDSRIAVMADWNTASASEALLGCMLDYGAITYSNVCLSERGGVAKTYGKGIMQTTYLLGISAGAIKLTTAEICWPVSGTSIHDRGVLPEDGAITVAEDYGVDREIEEAVLKLFPKNMENV